MFETKILQRILFKHNFTQKEFDTIIKKAREKTISPAKYLLRNNIFSEEALFQSLAEILDLPFVDLKNESIDVSAFEMIPRFFRETHSLVGYKKEDARLFLATSQPSLIEKKIEEYLQYKTGLSLRWSMSSPHSIQNYIDSLFSQTKKEKIEREHSSISFQKQKPPSLPISLEPKQNQISPSLLEKIQRFLSLGTGILWITGKDMTGKNQALNDILDTVDGQKKLAYFFGEKREHHSPWIQNIHDGQKILRRKILQKFLTKGDAEIISLSEIQEEEIFLLYQIASSGRLVIGSFSTPDSSPITPRGFRHVPTLILRTELMPTLCHYCMVRDKNEKNIFAKIKKQISDPKIRTQLLSSFQHFIGTGCKYCQHTGYKGQTMVLALEENSFWHEVLRKMKQGVISYDSGW